MSSLSIDKRYSETKPSCFKIKCYNNNNNKYLIYACGKEQCSESEYKVNICSKQYESIKFSGLYGSLTCNDPIEMCSDDINTTPEPTTEKPTTEIPTTVTPTTEVPTTIQPTTEIPTTTTQEPTTEIPTTTLPPTTPLPTTEKPTTEAPTTITPTTTVEPTIANDNSEFISLLNSDERVVYLSKDSYLLDMNNYNVNDIRINFKNLKGQSTDDNKVKTNITLLYHLTDKTSSIIPTIELFPDFSNIKVEKINFNTSLLMIE